MRKLWIGLALTGILFFSSCIASLYPLYTADTEVFEPALLGLWQEGKESFLFEKAPNGEYYKLTYQGEEDPPSIIETHLVKLGEHYYLDLKRWKDSDNLYDYNVLAPSIDAHNFARVVWDQKQIQIILFDGEKIEQLLDQRRARIKHEKVDNDQFILTAKPEELQQFITKYAEELLDFKEAMVLPKANGK